MKTTESKKAYELNITVNGKNSVIVNAAFHGKMKLAEALNNAIYNSENYDVIIIRRNLNSEDALVINVAEYKAAAHDEYTATTDTKNIEKALLNIVKAYGKGDIEGNLNTDNTEETVDSTEEISEEIAEINAADVKVNVAANGKVIEQIKVSVDTAINIINRLNYRNDSFIYRFTTRYDNADIQCRHFDAYKADGEKDAFAITEYVINGKLEIVRFFNHFRNIIVDLQIGNVNYTIGDKGAIVLTAADEIADNNAAVEAESEIVNPCRFMVHIKYFSYEKGFIGYGGEQEDFATATAAAKWILAWTANRPFDTVTKDTVIYDFNNYAEEYRLTDADLNILNNSPAELDGSEEDIDDENVFDYLPALAELNDVDIDNDDDNPCRFDWDDSAIANEPDEIANFISLPEIPAGNLEPAEEFVEEYIFVDAAPVNYIVKVKCTCNVINGEKLLTQYGKARIVRSDKYGAEIQFADNGNIAYYTFDDKNFDRQAEADFFAIMQDRGACSADQSVKPAAAAKLAG